MRSELISIVKLDTIASPRGTIEGTLRSNDADGNENVKKQ